MFPTLTLETWGGYFKIFEISVFYQTTIYHIVSIGKLNFLIFNFSNTETAGVE